MTELQGLRSSAAQSPGGAAPPHLGSERAGPRRLATRATMSAETADFVLRRLFSAGLALGSCVRVLDDVTARRVATVIRDLDDISITVRRASRRDPEGRPEAGPLPPREALLAGMHGAIGDLVEHVDAMGRSNGADPVESAHLLEAAQSLQRAVMCLGADAEDAWAAMGRTALTGEASSDPS